MVAVKICGIRRLEDVEYINSFKPDYIGFIFADSKRKVSMEDARKLSSKLNSDILKVGVFVNEDIDILLQIADYVGLDIIQLHGDETVEYIEQIPKIYKVWKAIRVRNKSDIDLAIKYDNLDKVDKILLDAYSESDYGGVGETFDWRLLEESRLNDFILAGGLNPANIEDAISKYKPYGVDVSSGVEVDGYKNLEKIGKFIEKVRS